MALPSLTSALPSTIPSSKFPFLILLVTTSGPPNNMLLLFFLDLSTLDIIYSSRSSIDRALNSFIPPLHLMPPLFLIQLLFSVHLFFYICYYKKFSFTQFFFFFALSILDRIQNYKLSAFKDEATSLPLLSSISPLLKVPSSCTFLF